MKRIGFAAALFAVLGATAPVTAQDVDPEDRVAARQELEQARSELAEAARRVAELSRQLGEERSIQIRTRHSGSRPMLGLVMGGSSERGVRLQAVTPEAPAAQAGLRSGDIITRVDGQAIAGADDGARLDDARRRLADLVEGQQVLLDYERDGRVQTTTVTARAMTPYAVFSGTPGLAGLEALSELEGLSGLEALSSLQGLAGLSSLEGLNIDIDVEQIRKSVQSGLEQMEGGLHGLGERIRVIAPMLEDGLRFDAWRWQGLRLAALDADLARYFGSQQGALVLKVDGDALASLRGGDIIQSVDGDSVGDPRSTMRRLAAVDPGQSVRLGVLRERRGIELDVIAPEQPDLLRWMPPPAPPEPPSPPQPPASPPPPVPPSAPVMGIAL